MSRVTDLVSRAETYARDVCKDFIVTAFYEGCGTNTRTDIDAVALDVCVEHFVTQFCQLVLEYENGDISALGRMDRLLFTAINDGYEIGMAQAIQMDSGLETRVTKRLPRTHSHWQDHAYTDRTYVLSDLLRSYPNPDFGANVGSTHPWCVARLQKLPSE